MRDDLPLDREPDARRSEAAPARLPRLPVWLVAALLGVVTLFVYLPTLRDGFIQFDDPGYVTANARVQGGLSWSNAAWAFRTMSMANWHPLAWLSHMLDCQLFGLQPAGHHATSILLHALNAMLVFLLLRKATGFRWRSLIVASVFALHPLNVETVAWISERKSLLSMAFSLLTIALYGWYVRAPNWRRYLAVIGGFALALLSKPMAVTLPLVLILLDYWPLRRISPNRNEWRGQVGRLILEKTPLLIMTAGSCWITILAQKRGGAVRSLHAVPLPLRLENAAVACLTYMRRMFWPSDLTYLYPLQGVPPQWKVWTAVLLLLAITVLVYRFRQRRHLVFGWLLFVLTLLPVIGIVQVGAQSMADRYAYIPLLGLFTALTWEAAEFAAAMRIPAAAQTLPMLLLLGLAAHGTRLTEGYWRSDLTLFQRAQEVVHPANFEIETNLAAALSDAGRYSEARAYFQNAESIEPASFTAHYNCGYLLARQGDQAGAAAEFQQALRLASSRPQKARAWNSLGIAYLNLGEYRQAAETFEALLSLEPDNTNAAALRKQALSLQITQPPRSTSRVRGGELR